MEQRSIIALSISRSAIQVYTYVSSLLDWLNILPTPKKKKNKQNP